MARTGSQSILPSRRCLEEIGDEEGSEIDDRCAGLVCSIRTSHSCFDALSSSNDYKELALRRMSGDVEIQRLRLNCVRRDWLELGLDRRSKPLLRRSVSSIHCNKKSMRSVRNDQSWTLEVIES